MSIYALSDLHLSFAKHKPMDIFGPAWEGHEERIRSNWEQTVAPEDLVLMPGDLSWAMRLPEARPDLAFVDALPGRKVVIRGNHDYWWHRKATSRIQREVGGTMTFIQGASVVVGPVGITGTRGWRSDWGSREARSECPDEDQAARIFQRELQYLENGLLSIPDSVSVRIAMLHFPPFDEKLRPNEFAEVLSRHSVDILVYGHVHLGIGGWLEGPVGGVNYRLVSADVVGFAPQLVLDRR